MPSHADSATDFDRHATHYVPSPRARAFRTLFGFLLLAFLIAVGVAT